MLVDILRHIDNVAVFWQNDQEAIECFHHHIFIDVINKLTVDAVFDGLIIFNWLNIENGVYRKSPSILLVVLAIFHF